MELLYLAVSIFLVIRPSSTAHIGLHKTCSNGQLRLTNTSYGTLQICRDHEWRIICSSDWGHLDSAVACKELGYDGGYTSNAWSSIPGTVEPIQYHCNGREEHLQDCPHEDYPYCSGYNQVKLDCVERNASDPCRNGDIRLWGGQTEYEGSIELCNDHGVWSAVCDQDWSSADAVVACRQLNFTNTIAMAYSGSSFDVRLQVMEFGGLQCSGKETSLQKCSVSSFFAELLSEPIFCNSRNHAGVRCIPKSTGNCTNGTVRLVDGYAENNGYAEICIDGLWIGICYSSITYRLDSRSSIILSRLCSELGYPRYTRIDESFLQKSRNEPPAYVTLRYSWYKPCTTLLDCVRTSSSSGFAYYAPTKCTPITLLCCPNDTESCNFQPITPTSLPPSTEPCAPQSTSAQDSTAPTPTYSSIDKDNKTGEFQLQFGTTATSLIISSFRDFRGLKEDIESRIINDISSGCNCLFNTSSLKDGVFVFGETMSYHGKVLEMDGQSPARLLAMLKESIEKQPQISCHCNHIHVSLEVTKLILP